MRQRRHSTAPFSARSWPALFLYFHRLLLTLLQQRPRGKLPRVRRLDGSSPVGMEHSTQGHQVLGRLPVQSLGAGGRRRLLYFWPGFRRLLRSLFCGTGWCLRRSASDVLRDGLHPHRGTTGPWFRVLGSHRSALLLGRWCRRSHGGSSFVAGRCGCGLF
jgi:hypothetical protein